MALPASPQTVAERISLKDFFDNPKISSAAISPDGKRLAFLAPESNCLNVWVSDVGNGLDSAKVITHDGQGVLRFSLVLTDMNPAAQIWALQPFEGKESPFDSSDFAQCGSQAILTGIGTEFS